MKYYIALMLLIPTCFGGQPASKELIYKVAGACVKLHMNPRNIDRRCCNSCGHDAPLMFTSTTSPFMYCPKHIVERHPDFINTVFTEQTKKSGISKIIAIELEHGNY